MAEPDGETMLSRAISCAKEDRRLIATLDEYALPA
jgi:hypothetical protein